MVPVMVADREKSCSKFGAGDGVARNWPQSGGELTKRCTACNWCSDQSGLDQLGQSAPGQVAQASINCIKWAKCTGAILAILVILAKPSLPTHLDSCPTNEDQYLEYLQRIECTETLVDREL